jgi:hypothetical protein
MKKILLFLLSCLGGFIVFQITWEILPHPKELLALISGLLVPLIASIYLFSDNSSRDTETEYTTTKIVSELALLAFIGFVIQQSSYGDAPYYTGIFNEYIGFTLFLPIFGSIMHFLYNRSYIQTKFSITITSIIIAIAIHVLNYILYPLVGGHAEQMYGIILIFGLPIAIIFGSIYAIYFIKTFFNKSSNS